MAEKKDVKILSLDIRAFDPRYQTVTFDFKIKRIYDPPRGGMIVSDVDGSAIVLVTGRCIDEENAEEILQTTKIIWYQPEITSPYYVCTDETTLKDKMRKIAYKVIWEIRNA